MTAVRRGSSLGSRITWLVLLTSATAIILVSLALATINHRAAKQTAYASLRAQATLAALNSAAPMAFGDAETAVEVLEGLSKLPDVTGATVHAQDGSTFARHDKPDSEEALSSLLADGEHALGKHYVVVLPIEERGQRFGTLQVTYDLTPLRQRLMNNMLLAATICAGALLLCAAAARKGAAILVRRLGVLDATARRVSETRDYSMRAKATGDDEIARFTATFNEMLEQIQAQDEELRTSRQQALQASRLKDEFLATVSHELRTPITPIAGWAQILRHIGRSNPPVLEAAAVIERNADAMKTIVNDLLDMSTIISGKIELDVSDFPLHDLVHDAIGALQESAQVKGIVLCAEVDRDLSVRADRHRLQQVLWNLLTNAIKFTPAQGAATVTAKAIGESIEIVVSDTGEGIDVEFLPFMFERFRQADSSITRRHGGLGLGLAIVRQLVELHGGTIEAHSAGPGTGASFTVTLTRGVPAVAAAASTAVDQPLPLVADAAAPGTRLQDVRVLIVEDDADSREWLLRILAREGADTRGAHCATEALELLATFTPHVLVSDIAMPDCDGHQLIRAVRQLAPSAGGRIPALALSALARDQDRSRSLAAGFDEHQGKPVDTAALVEHVSRLAAAHRA